MILSVEVYTHITARTLSYKRTRTDNFAAYQRKNIGIQATKMSLIFHRDRTDSFLYTAAWNCVFRSKR